MAKTKPATFTVTRSIVIAAPPETIFPLIEDLHAWQGWSPWEKVPGDQLIKTFSGARNGVGAIYEWMGKRTGQGRMEVTRSSPSSHIEIDPLFIKPSKAQNKTEFLLTSASGGTKVTWTMTRPSAVISKVMGLIMNMHKTLGAAFEKGLASMKSIAEG